VSGHSPTVTFSVSGGFSPFRSEFSALQAAAATHKQNAPTLMVGVFRLLAPAEVAGFARAWLEH
jgi:hypothetical protein